MARKRYSDPDVLTLLREIDVHLHDGLDVVSACRKAGISDKSYYYWRNVQLVSDACAASTSELHEAALTIFADRSEQLTMTNTDKVIGSRGPMKALS